MTQLVGYRGADERLIFGGLAIEIPAQASSAGIEQPAESDPESTNPEPKELESDPLPGIDQNPEHDQSADSQDDEPVIKSSDEVEGVESDSEDPAPADSRAP